MFRDGRANLYPDKNIAQITIAALTIHPEAIYGICDHVKSKPDGDDLENPFFKKKGTQKINRNNVFRV